ncbi:hypothetical protein AAE478_000406 [Parahypoxylon ruwenzoriense]
MAINLSNLLDQASPIMKFRGILAATYLVGAALAQVGKLKIMPLGDSITELTCWRAKLWERLETDDLIERIEFVGSKNNTQECEAAAGDDNWKKQHHEGHTGYLAIDVAYDHLSRWINDTRPDVVMYMLGTDDIARGRRIEDVVEAYTDMVHTMRRYNENMMIIVETVLPLPTNMNPVKRLNDMITDWAREQNKTESPIYVADLYPYPNSALRDGIHPNDAGEDIIVDALSPLLTWIINANSTGSATDPFL